MSSNPRRVPRSDAPPSLLLRRPMLIGLTLLLSYATGGWLTTLHEIEGATEAFAVSPLLHWLRDATLALPLIAVGVWLASQLARRVLERAGPDTSPRLADGVAAGVVAVYASVVLAVGNPLHDQLFGGHAHGGRELPLFLHLLRDGLLAFASNLLITALVAAVAASRARFVAQLRARRRTVYRAAMATAMLVPTVFSPMQALPAAAATTLDPGNPCQAGAPLKHFDITALDVKMPLNRFGDNDPKGKMYVLNQHLADVRAEESSQQVSIGLRDDPIQALVIRANEGDCVDIAFTNAINDTSSYGIHIDGLGFQAGSSGDAVGNNPIGDVPRTGTAHYVYYVPNDPDLEGAHFLHPGPGNRAANNHGLFGALVVEPAGSVYLKQKTTSADGVHPDPAVPLDAGWEAMIVPPAPARAFRENVQLYHEIGNESENVYDKNGNALPTIDPHTESYRPGTRGMNYRSEPFMDRLNFAPEQESGAYSSYSFSDPATVTPHSYQADPMKFRILHAGSELFHVFHLHGGGIRWRLNPKADPTWHYGDTGLAKTPVVYSNSARTDSQAFGPGEAYNLEIEGGSGGVQQGAGEFLFHCHIVKHYDSGMWGFWRVFNTLQPDLAPLPDRVAPPVAVTSDQLIGKTFNGVTLTADNLDQWLRPQLPAQGVRNNDDDAEVWNWSVDTSSGAPVYLGEPDDTNSVNYPGTLNGVAGHPFSYNVDQYLPGGNRPKILFDPNNGRYAWPLMRPHIGIRPPFSGNGHTGAPYLGEDVNAAPKPGVQVDPYANRPDGLCPQGAPLRHYNIVAIMPSVQVTAAGATDPQGLIFSLAQDKAGFYNGTRPAEPLAIRANVGDCVAMTLTNEEVDAKTFGGHAKVNLHIHHVQFDTNASDGVITGMEFEQSVRPYQAEDPQLTVDALVGDSVVHLASVAKFHPGAFVGIGLGTENIEIRQIVAIDPVANTLTLDRALNGGCAPIDNAQPGACKPLAITGVAHAHGEWAGAEFIQERWYPDVELDNIFFHDHVDGIHGWGHGLVGELNIEPRGATYHDPHSGTLTDGAGALSDIWVPAPPAGETAAQAQTALAPGFVDGSFREFSLFTLNDNPLTDSTLNLRAEPWADRTPPLGAPIDASDRFSSYAWGDPYTPLPRAYPGDPVVIRTLNISQRVDSLHIDGHRAFWENRFVPTGNNKPISTPTDTIHYGVSERYTLILDGGAGGPNHVAGDYLYMNGLDQRFRQGAWGLLRVLPGVPAQSDPNYVVPLPDHAAPAAGFAAPARTGNRPPAFNGADNPCPSGAPQHAFAISAVDLPSTVAGGGQDGRKSAFVPTSQASAVKAGQVFPEPLVAHVAQGECVVVTLTDARETARTAFHLGGLLGLAGSAGINAGFNAEQSIGPGETRTYHFFADDAKVGSAPIADMGGDDAARDGSYGAMIVAPAGATFTDSLTGVKTDVGTRVDVHVPGQPGYRDFSMLFAQQDAIIGTDHMPYPPSATGPALVNYRTAGPRTDPSHPFSSLTNGDPATPIFAGYVGDPVQVHLLNAPGSEQVTSAYLGGLSFPQDPFITDSEKKQSRGLGPWERFDAVVEGGLGGAGKLVGDMVYGDRRLTYVENGMWGLIRSLSGANTVNCTQQSNGTPAPRLLDGTTCGTGGTVAAGSTSGTTVTSGPPTITAAPSIDLQAGTHLTLTAGTPSLSTFPATLMWTGAGNIDHYEVQVSYNLNGGAWTAFGTTLPGSRQLPGTPTGGTAATVQGSNGTLTSSLPTGQLAIVSGVPKVVVYGYQFQVRACAADATCSAWSQTPKSLVAMVDDSATTILSAGAGQVAYSGNWQTRFAPGAFGGTVRYTTSAGANAALQNATFSVSGDAAWIAPRGPNMGIATVSVDGGPAQSVDLYATTYQGAQVVFATNGLQAGVQHTLRVTVTGTKNPFAGGDEVDIDAFLAIH